MTPSQILVVASRLFALLLGFTLFAYVPSAFGFFRMEPSAGQIATMVSVSLGMIAVALYLWLFPVSMAKRLLPMPLEESGEEIPRTTDEWFLLGSRLMGLWVLCRSIPLLLMQLLYIVQMNEEDARTIWHGGAPKGPITIRLVLDCALAAWLLFGSRGLLGLLHLARGKQS